MCKPGVVGVKVATTTNSKKLNFNRDGLKPYFSTNFDAFYFSNFVTRWRYFRSSIYCEIRRVVRLTATQLSAIKLL